MPSQFDIFLSQLLKTNSTLSFFTDFDKVRTNVNKIAIKLNQLNYLLGKENLNEAVAELFEENPKVFQILGILLAIRQSKSTMTYNKDGVIVDFNSFFNTHLGVIEFLEETGLKEVFVNNDITNLVDYVFGIEVGLDTNARKNRGGESMSKAVSLLFDNGGVYYKKEVNNTGFIEIQSLGADVKRFDFVIKTEAKTYLIETNFYNGGGSKLNETARAYSDIAPKINQYPNFEFVWITDGVGWLKAKNKLQEAFSIIPSLYNLTTLNEFIDKLHTEGIINNW
jgi:type II restriction enzyme